LYLCAKFGAERRNAMEELQEVGKSRLAEYKAIEKEVDAEAERLTREELGMPEDGKLVVKSLAKGSPYWKKTITKVYLLGYGTLKAQQTSEGLIINLPIPCNKIAPVFRITK